jgi:hypothetical protein
VVLREGARYGPSDWGLRWSGSAARPSDASFELLGRMDTSMRFCFKGMASLRALTGGFIGSTHGVYMALVVGVGGLFLAVAGLRFSNLIEI